MFMTIAAFSLIAAPAPQLDRTVEIDGESVSYARSSDERGRIVLEGVRATDGTPFRFVVSKDGKVRGTVGTTRVKFKAR